MRPTLFEFAGGEPAFFLALAQGPEGRDATTAGLHESGPVTGYLTYKRWRLRDGVDIAEVLDIVSRRIIPHYRRLDPAVRLGLEAIEASQSVLAIQQWPDRAHHDQTVRGTSFESWFDDYRPILQDWDRLVEFETEWESVRLV